MKKYIVKVTAKNTNELYLMSAMLSSSILYNLTFVKNQVILYGSIKVDENNFIGSIVIRNVNNAVFDSIKLELLRNLSIKNNNEIEIVTNKQIVKCFVSKIDLYFTYDMDMPS